MNVQFLLRNKFIQRAISLNRIKRLHILGIESSCDDAAISIVHFEGRKVLTDRRSSDYAVLARAGGVLPYASARHHQLAIPRLISECLAESGIRASDIDAVAVSNRPGIVVSLRVGINYALSFARSIRRPLILVHHMRAHALTMRLFDSNLPFPFAVLLISGAHCLFCLAESPFHFRILVKSEEGSSPGECLDKLARQMDIPPKNGHYGAALEEMAKSCSPQSYQNYKIPLRRKIIENSDWNFDSLKQRYLARIKLDKKKMDKAQHTEEEKNNEIANLCAAIQESVIEYVCLHLEPALAFLAQNVPEFIANPATRNLVVSGGVAANAQFLDTIRSVSAKYQFNVAVPPPNLCSDNGVMVAWTGAEMFNWIQSGKEMPTENGNGEESHIYWPNELPDSLPAFPRAKIGPEIQWRETEKKEEIFRVQNSF